MPRIAGREFRGNKHKRRHDGGAKDTGGTAQAMPVAMFGAVVCVSVHRLNSTRRPGPADSPGRAL